MASQPDQPLYTPTAQQDRARSILLKLPVEIVFRIWGIVLSQVDDTYEDFNTVLNCFPELSLDIITNDVERCASMYTDNTRRPRMLSLDEHEKETARQEHMDGRLIRRVMVLFECDEAVQTGQLSAYESCRYARLFFSPLIDASYYLLPHHEGNRGYTEELLVRFPAMERSLSGRLHVVRIHQASDAASEVETSGDAHETTTTLRSRDNGTVLDYRISLSEQCHSNHERVQHLGERPRACINPLVELTGDTLRARFVHISFRGSRVPIIGYTEPGYCGQYKPFPLKEYLSTMYELGRSLPMVLGSRFSMENLNWSLTTPRGADPCEHAMDVATRDLFDRENYSSNRVPFSRKMYFTDFYRSIWYYGLPDATLNRTDARRNVEELVWFRLSRQHPPTVQLPARRRPFLVGTAFRRLAIFTELSKHYHDRALLPNFHGPTDMECIQLVALENSDQVWDQLDSLISTDTLERLRALILLQLRRCNRNTRSPLLEIGWDQISSMAHLVQQLHIGGYLPVFALPYNTLDPKAVVFTRLVFLCLDVSTLTTTRLSNGEDWYDVSLPECLFPHLTHLYLKAMISMSSSSVYPRVILSKRCKTLELSSVIRTKASVGGQLLKIPNIRVVPDTFNRWEMSESGEYVYRGTWHRSASEYQIEEVDQALRAV